MREEYRKKIQRETRKIFIEIEREEEENKEKEYRERYIRGEFNKFPEFFVQAFKIVIDS